MMAGMGGYDLEKLSDSRILYLRNPPKFIHISLAIVIVILAAVIIWSCVTVKAEEVENAGIVSDYGSSEIVMTVSGSVSEICSQEGAEVKEGDVLFRVDASSVEAERAVYQKTLDYYTERAALVDRFLDYLDSGKSNPFSDEGSESEFCNLVKTYNSEIAQITDTEQKESVRLKYIANMYSQLQQYNSERDTAENYMSAYAQDTSQYEYYKNIADEYQEMIDDTEDMLKALESGSLRNPFSSSSQKEYYNLFESYLSELDQLDGSEQRKAVRLKYVSSMQSEKNTCEQQIRSAEGSISVCDINISKYVMYSPCSGIVHYDSDLKPGSFIQSGSSVGSVSPDSQKIVEMYISAHDRAMIDVGDECRFTVDGLIQTEFGSVSGRISSIASNATVTDSGAFFRVTVEFDERELTDSHGGSIRIIDGMTVKVWTVYEKSTYMQYFLEKLGFR